MPSFRSHIVYWVTKVVVKTFYNPKSTIQKLRKEFVTSIKLIPQRSAGTFVYDTIEGISSIWITPDVLKTDGVVLYFHGGGYAVCSPNTHRKMCSIMAKEAGTKFLLIDYRLAPENPFPAAIEDALKSYRWLLTNGYSPDKIVFGGDSAGGGLTVATMLSAREQNLPLPKAAFCLSPWLDLTASGDSYVTNRNTDAYIDYESILNWRGFYAPNEELLSNPLVSPLFADLNGLPDMFLQVGKTEILLSDSQSFYKKAKESGVNITLEEWPNMIHVWQMWTGILPEANQAIAKIGNFLKESLKGS